MTCEGITILRLSNPELLLSFNVRSQANFRINAPSYSVPALSVPALSVPALSVPARRTVVLPTHPPVKEDPVHK